jgi:allantoinase
MVDLVIRGGRVVTRAGVRDADIAVADGVIVDVGPELPGGRDEIDARGLMVWPGVVDAHVHFNEPGRTEWEGGATGSRALAAGGGTTFFDMPLNSTPCTISVEDFDRKRTALDASSIADFGLWGGIVPGRTAEMAGMAGRGVVGFKAFMCESGLPEFPRADDRTLREAMREAARLGRPVAVHAESEPMLQVIARGIAGRDAGAFLRSRPVAVEVDAIERAAVLAAETGASLHIVHVSSGAGVAAAADARARGVDVTIETCPHYLCFADTDLARIGVVAKCAPPLRSEAEQAALWAAVLDGRVDLIGSDHSPAPPDLKVESDVMGSWGGVAGVQATLSALLARGCLARGLPFERLASLVADTPARRFGIPRKGALEAGYDADLVLVDPERVRPLRREDLWQRHPVSPYLGLPIHGAVIRTIRRGETLYLDGRIVASGGGRLVRPD